MATTTKITRQQLRDEGRVIVGEWGYGSPSTSGHIVCRLEYLPAVQAAYDAIPDGDMGPDVLAEVIAVGGEFVVGL